MHAFASLFLVYSPEFTSLKISNIRNQLNSDFKANARAGVAQRRDSRSKATTEIRTCKLGCRTIRDSEPCPHELVQGQTFERIESQNS